MAVLAAALVIIVGGVAVIGPAFAIDFVVERRASRRFGRAVEHDDLEHMLREWLSARA